MKHPLFLVGALALLAPMSWSEANNAPIIFEAENPLAIRSPFEKVVTNSGQAPGGAYLLAPWDENKAKRVGSVVYKFNVEKSGLFYIWARTFWTPGQGNSIKVSVKTGDYKILGEDGTYNQWHWVGGRSRVTLKAGHNTLTLLYSEAGVRIDQFLLTQQEPATSSPHRKLVP